MMKRNAHHTICCEDVTYDIVSDVLYSLKAEMSLIGDAVLNNMWYGTRVAADVWGRLKKISVFHRLLESIRGALVRQGSLCLNCHQVQTVIEAVRKMINNCSGNISLGLSVTTSGRAAWTAQNPFCVPYDKYEACMYEVSEMMGINIQRVEKKSACDLSFGVVSKIIPCDVFVEIAKNYKDCTIKYDIFTDSKTCDIKYQGVLSKKECKVGYRSLLKETKCNVEYHDYVNVVNCGVSPKFIQTVYSCGLSVKYSAGRKCPVLVSSGGNEYYFNDFNVVNEADIWNQLSLMNIA